MPRVMNRNIKQFQVCEERDDAGNRVQRVYILTESSGIWSGVVEQGDEGPVVDFIPLKQTGAIA